MPQTIEHNKSFHLARRIAKLIAPDFRVFATHELKPREVVLDLKNRTIEIGEKTTSFDAVGAILFSVGQLKLRKEGKYAEHFGDLSKIASQSESQIVSLLAKQGEKSDKIAALWASSVFVSNWNISAERAASIVESYVWNESEWYDYYQNETPHLWKN